MTPTDNEQVQGRIRRQPKVYISKTRAKAYRNQGIPVHQDEHGYYRQSVSPKIYNVHESMLTGWQPLNDKIMLKGLSLGELCGQVYSGLYSRPTAPDIRGKSRLFVSLETERVDYERFGLSLHNNN